MFRLGQTLVILTAVTTPELTQTLLQLKRHERRITLYSLAQDAPPMVPRNPDHTPSLSGVFRQNDLSKIDPVQSLA